MEIRSAGTSRFGNRSYKTFNLQVMLESALHLPPRRREFVRRFNRKRASNILVNFSGVQCPVVNAVDGDGAVAGSPRLGLAMREDCVQRHVMLFVPLYASAKLGAFFAIYIGGHFVPAFKDEMRPVPFASPNRQSRLAVVKVLACADCALGDTYVLKIPGATVIQPDSHVLHRVLSEMPAVRRGGAPPPANRR